MSIKLGLVMTNMIPKFQLTETFQVQRGALTLKHQSTLPLFLCIFVVIHFKKILCYQIIKQCSSMEKSEWLPFSYFCLSALVRLYRNLSSVQCPLIIYFRFFFSSHILDFHSQGKKRKLQLANNSRNPHLQHFSYFYIVTIFKYNTIKSKLENNLIKKDLLSKTQL